MARSIAPTHQFSSDIPHFHLNDAESSCTSLSIRNTEKNKARNGRLGSQLSLLWEAMTT